jgi:transposase
MPRVAPAVSLDPTTKATLDHLVRSPSTRHGLVLRCRIILAAALGKTNQQIAGAVQMPEVTVSKWRRRFASRGLEGLQDAARCGRPLKHGLEINIRTFNFSPDPDFEAKLLDIVGLYLNPPENALVLCVDEKTGIQALDRTQPLLPLSAKKPRSWTNEYVRHGTQTLLAALEIASGQVVAHVKQRRTSVNFLRFLKDVIAAFPQRELHMILDNLNIHNNDAARRWLKRHPHVHFHYTPTHASWVNMVECFFSILGKQALSQSVHTSKHQLKEFLLDYIARNNENPRPFVWTKGPEKLQRIIEATKEYQAAHPRKPRKRRRTQNTIKQ